MDNDADYRGMFLSLGQMAEIPITGSHCRASSVELNSYGNWCSSTKSILLNRGLCILAPYWNVHQQLAVVQ